MTLSPDAAKLLERARIAEHAVDVYLAPGAVRLEADRLAEVLHSTPPAQLDEHALWNLLFSAGELSHQVDVYRAHALFLAACDAVAQHAACCTPGDDRSAVVEMCFDFFFARQGHPLLPLRAPDVLGALAKLLEGDARAAKRAAIHGLGHLVALGHTWGQDAVLVLDDFTTTSTDPELRRYADEARSGTLR